MTYSSNLPDVIKTVNLKLTSLQIEDMTNLQATSLLAVMRDRIHVQGKDSSGGQIGTYTPAYIKYVREKRKRGSDNKVILSLTTQMENGYRLYKLDNGTGIGFTAGEDWQKARWCEETYQKPIFSPTAEEKALVRQIADDYIAQHIKS